VNYRKIEEPSHAFVEAIKEMYKVIPTRETPFFDMGRVDRLMQGAIDVHIHGGPDAWSPRHFNDIQLAMQACEAGMGAIVIKCHTAPSARSTQLAQWTVDQWAKEHNKGSIRIIGGIVLNYNVGGLNPEAVEMTARLGGKFIWTPNLDSSHQHKLTGKPGGIEVITKKDKVVPELMEIFEIIAKHDLVLSLCHHSSRERFVMIDAAKEVGVKRIEIVHAFYCITKMTIDQMKMAAEKGVYIGHYCHTFHPPDFSWDETLRAIKEVGADHFVLGTDLGTWKLPPPLTSYRTFVGTLLEKGVPEAEVEKMTRVNPERLIF
jgi:hypothetical protein